MISVIIPAYNAERYIAKAIDSVLSQSCSDLELIVVDDGSTDGTVNIVKSYSDPRIRYIYQENASQAMARNKGMEVAIGDFIAFLDADDIWLADKLKEQIQLFNNPEVGVVFCGAKLIDENGHIYGNKHQEIHQGNVLKNILYANFVVCSSVILRRSILKDNGLKFRPDRKGVEDWDMWCQIAFFCKFAYSKKRLVLYREHIGGISKNNDLMLESYAQMLKDIREDILHSNLLTENKKCVLLNILRKGYRFYYLRYMHCFLYDGDIERSRNCLQKALKGNLFNYRYIWGMMKFIIISLFHKTKRK